MFFNYLCTDVDECRSNWTDCHPSAFCINRNPGFDCVCTPEYEGDGVECTRKLTNNLQINGRALQFFRTF